MKQILLILATILFVVSSSVSAYSADGSTRKNYSFVKQYAGEFEGKYLLMITNKHGRDTSFAVLLPLFDVNKPSKELDDNKPLWKVVSAKLNGRLY